MTANPGDDPRAVTEAEGKLARLGVQIQSMQGVLVRLLQDVVQAETRLDHSLAAQLVEANEHLVLAVLSSQNQTDTVTEALHEAEQSHAVDALTQLPNRTALLAHFAQVVASAKRRGHRAALLFLDLDDFKALNDQHGHAFGDQVLRLCADRMRSQVRQVDTVSRHGGDEFVILMGELTQPSDAQTVAEKLIAALGAAAEVAGQVLHLTASIGIAIYPDHGEDLDTLVARADAAMYQSKRRRAGGYAFHDSQPVAWAAPPARPADAAQAGDEEHRLQQLREANEQLVLAALDAQALQAAAEQVRQRQTAFVAAVADELRNPMAPIRIANAILGRPPADEPLLQRVQDIVGQQMVQLSRLLGQIVESSGDRPGGLALEHRPVDLARVIDDAVAAQQPAMQERGQHFDLQRPDGALTVRGDAVRLQHVVGNLLDNASRFTHEGGHIGLAVAVDADRLTLTVSDDGIGITAQMLPHVFEPFVQDSHGLGFAAGGLGIGLTVVRALVQAHGGEVVAHSAGRGRGSRFVVTLPLAPTAQPGPGDAGPER